jgi:hypothetical protein
MLPPITKLELHARCQRLRLRVRSLEQSCKAAQASADLHRSWHLSSVEIIAGMQADIEATERRLAVAERALAAAQRPARSAAAAGPWSGTVSVYAAAGMVSLNPGAIPVSPVVPLQRRGAA